MASFDVSSSIGLSINSVQGGADGKFAPFILENLNSSSGIKGDLVLPLSESLTVSGNIAVMEIVSILEGISMADVVLGTGVYHNAIQESIEQSDFVAGIVTLVIQENLTIDDVVSNYLLYRSLIEEVCVINDIPFSTGLFHIALAVAFTLSDFITDLNELITEQITITDTLLEIVYLFQVVLEDASVNAVLSNTLNIFKIVDESIAVGDSQDNSATLHTAISEDLSFVIGMDINGVTYEGWVLNPENFAVWNYDNYNFNSLTVFNDMPLAASQNGLYELTGIDDDGEYIISKIKTASLDFGTSNLKQISDVIMGVSNSGRLVLKVSVDGEQTVYYELKPSTNNLQNQRIKVGKGLYGRFWQFELVTKENSTFILDTFEVLPFLFKRKLR